MPIEHGEISFDLVMDDDMRFVEGCYRLPKRDWQVMVFSRRPVAAPKFRDQKWDSGVTGIFVSYPEHVPLNEKMVTECLRKHFGVEQWEKVKGPDSMHLR